MYLFVNIIIKIKLYKKLHQKQWKLEKLSIRLAQCAMVRKPKETK